jgi:uncharacterized membrane protein
MKTEEYDMTDQSTSSDTTNDDKLWAALGYPIFLIAIIVLLMEEKKRRPFIKFHAVQALVVNVVLWALGLILTAVTLGFGSLCLPLLWLVTIFFAYQAYQGNYYEIPVITNFIKGQGWDKV